MRSTSGLAVVGITVVLAVIVSRFGSDSSFSSTPTPARTDAPQTSVRPAEATDDERRVKGNATKLIQAMAVECRSAVNGTSIQAAKITPARAELYLSSSEWLRMGSDDRRELERLMGAAFSDTKWVVHASGKMGTDCLSAPQVMASKPTAAEVAAEANQQRDREDGKRKAAYACKHKIEEVLNDPDSAKFLESDVEVGKDHYVVTWSVRGKNAYGGVVKNQLQCAVLSGTFVAAVLPR